jgi:hypothetical protein
MFVSSIDDSRHGMQSVHVNNVLRKVVPESKRCMAIEASFNSFPDLPHQLLQYTPKLSGRTVTDATPANPSSRRHACS